jgi:hypothetical protein
MAAIGWKRKSERPILMVAGVGLSFLALLSTTPAHAHARRAVDPVSIIDFLQLGENANRAVALARVVRVDRQAPEAYERFQRQYPLLDPQEYVQVNGGRLQVLELLKGPTIPAHIDIDFTTIPAFRGGPGLVRPNPQGHSLRWMQLGQYRLVTYDPKASDPNARLVHGVVLDGPDDKLLQIYRQSLQWRADPDRGRAKETAKQTLRDPLQPPALRAAAYYALYDLGVRQAAVPGTNVPEITRIMFPLLTEPNLHPRLLEFAIQSARVDITQGDIVVGSEGAKVIGYLLDRLHAEPAGPVVGTVAARLSTIAAQEGVLEGRKTLFYVPEIVSALERREALDKASSSKGRSHASGGLMSLQVAGWRRLEDIKDLPVVTRKLP